jgi:hypothetical protein
MPKAKSKAQARLFGLIAAGKKTRKATGMTRAEAKRRLRGVKIKKLPRRAKKRKKR